ncbi:nicotinate-nucleotide adenylyltransferase [Desnuesiella massiliensis]|uniref:nicotinate-nucleotide adenylyltransferase n=1 Tax=Desnuesiella massiliensis TaxID=1650662 RepID=UPI0006E37B58|nr:nicotinate-nucleotide adenylyltransferase [Desnuesiella massiliensis]
MKIGVFGGTFDPIHNGHLYIANEALKKLNLDQVIFMPSGNPPHKIKKVITDGNIRYEMVNMAVRDYKLFGVSDYEIRKQGLSFTFETLEYLNKLYENSTLYFITGADCLIDLHTWKAIDRILNACTFVVFNRPGYSKEDILKQKSIIEERFNKEIIFIELLNLEISSSYIRNSIKENLRVDYFLPSGVYNTIEALDLYKE